MTAILSVVTGLLLLAAFSSPAHAYIDPGTGSMLIQGLIGGVIGALFIIRMYWHKLKNFMARSTGVGVSEDETGVGEQASGEDH